VALNRAFPWRAREARGGCVIPVRRVFSCTVPRRRRSDPEVHTRRDAALPHHSGHRKDDMGFFDGILGNASEIDAQKAQMEFARLLAPGEQIEKAYQLIRDSFLFTNKRLILVDVQGLTGAKIEYHSIPYHNIHHFSVETAGHFDLDAELKIHLSGGIVVAKRFNKQLNIYEVHSVLASYVLR
jgi:hypothetical protein